MGSNTYTVSTVPDYGPGTQCLSVPNPPDHTARGQRIDDSVMLGPGGF